MQAPDPREPAANDSEGGQAEEDRQPPPQPDEPGPRDVPDDKVIEKTLPTTPPREERPD